MTFLSGSLLTLQKLYWRRKILYRKSIFTCLVYEIFLIRYRILIAFIPNSLFLFQSMFTSSFYPVRTKLWIWYELNLWRYMCWHIRLCNWNYTRPFISFGINCDLLLFSWVVNSGSSHFGSRLKGFGRRGALGRSSFERFRMSHVRATLAGKSFEAVVQGEFAVVSVATWLEGGGELLTPKPRLVPPSSPPSRSPSKESQRRRWHPRATRTPGGWPLANRGWPEPYACHLIRVGGLDHGHWAVLRLELSAQKVREKKKIWWFLITQCCFIRLADKSILRYRNQCQTWVWRVIKIEYSRNGCSISKVIKELCFDKKWPNMWVSLPQQFARSKGGRQNR